MKTAFLVICSFWGGFFFRASLDHAANGKDWKPHAYWAALAAFEAVVFIIIS